MDKCRHVNRITPAADHSILNPQKWLCSFCGTTESVWACLSCPNVACGRYTEIHALKHFEQTKHPLAIEVNEKYVYCYVCEDYILNDNAAGDIKILRSALSAIATHTFSDFESRGRRVLRSLSYPGYEKKWQDDKKLKKQDREFTAVKFRRYYLTARTFTAWRHYTKAIKKHRQNAAIEAAAATTSGEVKKELPPPSPAKLVSPPLTPTLRKRPVIPGVTGLRNLGNTCYMNSVLQVLRSFLANFSHLKEFNEYFMSLKNTETKESEALSPIGAPKNGKRETRHSQQSLLRQSTIECFKHINDGPVAGIKKGGLNGGGYSQSPAHRKKVRSKKSKIEAENETRSLCEELHALFRVMWSGKWAVVSPHKMLYTVWNIIPFFKGYTQQDAQEFLCEFIDKVQDEMVKGVPGAPSVTNGTSSANFMCDLFQGRLTSQVSCRRCSNQSVTYEPFMDLSLEFPKQYQSTSASAMAGKKCHLEEMLYKFTEKEKLDGRIYACTECNKRRRSAAARPTVLTEADKQLLISQLPAVLRLHLKRFMWSGRNNRGKITSHVKFEKELDMRPFCTEDITSPTFIYELSAIVIHHGRGFGSGHYTTFCYNREADSWVHCNDARVQLTTMEEVIKAQAYILFYTQKIMTVDEVEQPSSSCPQLKDSQDSSFEEQADEEIVFNFQNSTIPKFVELKRRLSTDGESEDNEKPKMKRARSLMW